MSQRLLLNARAPGKVDPTRTFLLRRRRQAELKRRFMALRKAIRKLIVDEDAFGLVKPEPFKVPTTRNTFCPTGEGGGVDPSCGAGDGGSALSFKRVELRPNRQWFREIAEEIRAGKTTIDEVVGELGETYGHGDVFPKHETIYKKLLERAETLADDAGKFGGTDPEDAAFDAMERTYDIRSMVRAELVRRLGPVVNAGRYAFHTSAEKVKAFQQWLAQQLGALIVSKQEEEIWRRYAEAGYKKGAGRAFDDVRKPLAKGGLDRPPVAKEYAERESGQRYRTVRGGFAVEKPVSDFYAGTKDEFLRSAFGRPVAIEKVKLMAGRAFDDLENVTSDMSARMSRTLTDGLVEGKGPREVARDLAKDVGIGENRSLAIARTEIIRAHAEGALDAMEQLGVEEVGVMVEFSATCHDGSCGVCPECEDLDGEVYTIDEMRGVIPVHVNCRCSPIPRIPRELTKNARGLRRGSLAKFSRLLNVFCKTGEGGGVDPSCSKGDMNGSSMISPNEVSIVDDDPDVIVVDDVPLKVTSGGDAGKAVDAQYVYDSLPESHRKYLERNGVKITTSAKNMDVKGLHTKANGTYTRQTKTVTVSDEVEGMFSRPEVIAHELGHAVDLSGIRQISAEEGFVEAFNKDISARNKKTYGGLGYFYTNAKEAFAQNYAALVGKLSYDREFHEKGFPNTLRWMRAELPKRGLKL